MLNSLRLSQKLNCLLCQSHFISSGNNKVWDWVPYIKDTKNVPTLYLILYIYLNAYFSVCLSVAYYVSVLTNNMHKKS